MVAGMRLVVNPEKVVIAEARRTLDDSRNRLEQAHAAALAVIERAAAPSPIEMTVASKP